jgi:hypothetical protein
MFKSIITTTTAKTHAVTEELAKKVQTKADVRRAKNAVKAGAEKQMAEYGAMLRLAEEQAERDAEVAKKEAELAALVARTVVMGEPVTTK